MDVMLPDLFWIGDRCYRLAALKSTTESYLSQGTNEWIDSTPMLNCPEINFGNEDDELIDVEKLIETLPNGKYQLSLSIPQTFWCKIIGSKGVTKKRIEIDTATAILIPRPMENGDIIIKGSSKRNIILAKKIIEEIVFSTRQKLLFTHFISIPMNCNEIKKNFFNFKEQVLKLCSKDRGIDESIFQNPDKLHLTVGTLVLANQKERNLAEKLLNNLYEESLKPLISINKSVLLEMKGIEYMNDDPAEVNVLYAKISFKHKDDIIQKIAENILQHFKHHKLLKSEENEVKLHVTLMNTLFREEELDELNIEVEGAVNKHNCNKKPRRTFNAVNILKGTPGGVPGWVFVLERTKDCLSFNSQRIFDEYLLQKEFPPEEEFVENPERDKTMK